MRVEIDEEDDYGVPITPLIDCVFLLLLFFATSTSFVNPEKDLNIDLPSATEGVTQPEESQDIVVNVTKAGTIIVHGKVLDTSALERLLQEAAADNKDQAVIIRGDQHTFHKYIVGVLNSCVKAQVKNLSIAHDLEEVQ
jgi:biopolymer transport protein ExbD